MSRILIVDDDAQVLKFLCAVLTRDGGEVQGVATAEEAKRLLGSQAFDLVIADYVMQPIGGLELLKHIQKTAPSVPVVFLSGYATVERALEVVKAGAFDYMTKPVNIDDLRDMVRRALQSGRDTQAQAVPGQGQREPKYGLPGIVAEGKPMRQVCDMMQRVMPVDMPILIEGPPGAGKELVARTIHEGGARAKAPFLAVDCTARPETLLDGRVFGGGAGAADKTGSIEKATGGTVYLHEAGALPGGLQEKLLRVLSKKELPAAGGAAAKPVNVRIMAGSSESLSQKVDSGQFREDLFLRLSPFCIEVPPLAEHIEDLPSLIRHLMRKCVESGEAPPELDADALLILRHYAWPGNVDELEVMVCDLRLKAKADVIGKDLLPLRILQAVDFTAAKGSRKDARDESRGKALRAFLRDKKRECILQVLAAAGGSREAAAEQLHMSVSDLEKYLDD